jgi:hypothetical protein
LINEANGVLFSHDFSVNNSTINNNFNKTDNNAQFHKYRLTEVKAILENSSYILNPFMEKMELNLENGTALDYLDCSFLGRHLRAGFHYLHDSVKHQFAGFAVLFFIIGIAIAISVICTIILVMILNKLMSFRKSQPKKEEPKPLDTSKTQMSDKDLVPNNQNTNPLDNVKSSSVQEPEPEPEVEEEKSVPPVEYNYDEPKAEDNYEESNGEEKNEVPFPQNTTSHEENY